MVVISAARRQLPRAHRQLQLLDALLEQLADPGPLLVDLLLDLFLDRSWKWMKRRNGRAGSWPPPPRVRRQDAASVQTPSVSLS
jgi:hypothetical protein